MRVLICLVVASTVALGIVMTVVALHGVGDGSPRGPHRGPIATPTAAYPR